MYIIYSLLFSLYSERVGNWRDPNFVKENWEEKGRDEPRNNRNSSFERRNGNNKRSDREDEDWSRPLPRDERLER